MDLDKVMREINSKYKNINVDSIEAGEKKGTYTMRLKPHMAYLDPRNTDLPLDYRHKLSSSVIYKDFLRRSDLDLAKQDVIDGKPHKLYETVQEYTWSKSVFGSFIDVLVYFASSGFYNDSKDPKVKLFFDHWCYDVGIRKLLDQIFIEYFKTGFVRIYKVLGKYQPKIKPLEPLKGKYKNVNGVPIAYQVLNPTQIRIDGSLWLNQTRLVMPISEEMKELLEKPEWKLTDHEKNLIKALPGDVKKSIKNGDDIVFNPKNIGEIDYMKMDYERYPIPMAARAFEDLEFKESLKQADYSAVDGVTHEILVVTIGSDEHPVTDVEHLKALAALFNTPSKAYNVFWNHTLKVERVEAQNTDSIFGKKKYEQVNSDLSGSFGILRPLIDGIIEGEANSEALKVGLKTVIARINFARRYASEWLESEYIPIAERLNMDVIPKIRFDDMELKDELQMMNQLQQMADRRIISYKSIQEKLGFDPSYELEQMGRERPLVIDGTLGIQGSPYQSSGGGANPPSSGRPSNEPPKTPEKPTPKGQTNYPTKVKPKKAASDEDVVNFFADMGVEDLESIAGLIDKIRETKEKDPEN